MMNYVESHPGLQVFKGFLYFSTGFGILSRGNSPSDEAYEAWDIAGELPRS